MFTSVTQGGNGISRINKMPVLRIDKKRYNFKMKDEMNPKTRKNMSDYTATDYADYAQVTIKSDAIRRIF